VRLRAGPELAIVNVSATGALTAGAFRLLPGTHVEVHVTTARGRTLVRARVVRCRVCDVTAARVGYQGAIAFGTVLDVSPGRPEAGTSFP